MYTETCTRAFGVCLGFGGGVGEDEDSNQNNNHSENIEKRKVRTDPQERKEACRNWLDTADKTCFNRADMAHACKKGRETKDSTDDNQSTKSENGIDIDGWHIVKGTCNNCECNAAQEHGPGSNRQASPTLDKFNRHNIMYGKKNGGSNAPNEPKLRNHKVADVTMGGN